MAGDISVKPAVDWVLVKLVYCMKPAVDWVIVKLVYCMKMVRFTLKYYRLALPSLALPGLSLWMFGSGELVASAVVRCAQHV